jgi:hypothetical protein
MDTVILTAALLSFLVLVGSWLALPHGTETTAAMRGAAIHQATAQA